MPLDPETSSSEPGARWRFHTTDRLGQFDIAVPVVDGWDASPPALAHLERALLQLDALYDLSVDAAEAAWISHYKGAPRPRSAWGLTRVFAHDDGNLVLTLYEGDYDTYGAWDVKITNSATTGVIRRQI